MQDENGIEETKQRILSPDSGLSPEEWKAFILELIIGLLAEGMGIRPMERALYRLGISRSAILRIGFQVGQSCQSLLDKKLRQLDCISLQLDEMHSHVGKWERPSQDRLEWDTLDEEEPSSSDYKGHTWTFLALDPKSRMIVSYLCGRHSPANAKKFLTDIKSRFNIMPTLATDGWTVYAKTIREVFKDEKINYGIVEKQKISYRTKEGKQIERVAGVTSRMVMGDAPLELISTSLVERVNREVRSHLRRQTRQTPAFSKKLENHTAAVALFVAYYNFCLKHRSLGNITPAMSMGIEKLPWTTRELIARAGCIDF